MKIPIDWILKDHHVILEITPMDNWWFTLMKYTDKSYLVASVMTKSLFGAIYFIVRIITLRIKYLKKDQNNDNNIHSHP